MVTNSYANRIDFQGDIIDLLQHICELYVIGTYVAYQHIEVGYEDYNLMLQTTDGKYFIKIFAKTREHREVTRYVSIVRAALKAGVYHPKLIELDDHDHGESLDGRVCFVVLEWLNGKTFWELQTKPDRIEYAQIISDIVKLHQSPYHPEFIYDSWAVNNFSSEFTKSKKMLTKKEYELIEPVLQDFMAINHADLPHAFVHGDIISTNTMKNENAIYIIDFSVANWMPRIQELAVLMSDLFFDANSAHNSAQIKTLLLEDYSSQLEFTKEERLALPVYTRAAHAMHVVRTRRFLQVNSNDSESQYWNALGLAGLQMGEIYNQ